MPTDRHWARGFTLVALVCIPLHMPAQLDLPEGSPTEESAPQEPDPRSPLESIGTAPAWNSSTRWNTRLKVTSFHSSTTGWATVAAPTAGHRFNSIFSMEVTMPIYLYRLAASRLPNPKPDATLVDQQCEPGDLILLGHARFRPQGSHYQLTSGISAPTGDETYGLSTGRVTFDLTNHLQRTFGLLTPTLAAGVGDSTTLANRLVTKTSTSLGPLAHFRAGLAVQVTRRFSFEAEGSEQLPLGDQKIYSTRIEESKTTTVITGHTVSERNGFTTVFYAVIDRHTIFSSYYSRSFKPGGDSVSLALTYSLRSYSPGKDIARDDLFR